MIKLISEIGINFNGDFRLIEEMIRQSSVGKADLVKFQLYSSQRVFGDDSRKKNEFTYDQVKMIKQICDAYRIDFFASVFDEERLDWCLDLGVDYFKIASRTIARESGLAAKIAHAGKKTYISLGQWREKALPLFDLENVSYFNCISKYPVSLFDIKESIGWKYTNRVVGLSDHSYGIANCLHHISLGANIIEKHFTLCKSSLGNDHVGSMTLDELKVLRELGDQLAIIRDLTILTAK